MVTNRLSPLLLSLVYALGAGLWIVYSDRALLVVAPDAAALSSLGTLKGLGFVAVSTLLLWIVLRRHASQLDAEMAITRRSEDALRAQAVTLELAHQAGDIGIWQFDPATRVVTHDDRARAHHRLPANQLTVEAAIARVHVDDRRRAAADFEAALRPGSAGQFATEYRVTDEQGREHWLSTHVRIVFEGEGRARRPVRVLGTSQDITARKRSELALHESEERLRQAQKMEAIGQLAGGVAHDFNNLLMVILGHAELMRGDHALPARLHESCEEIARAAERAAALTRQLLVFSRRQVMQLSDIDLNDVVHETTRMLRRVLGEDIELQVQDTPEALRVSADPGLLDMLLLNLAVNARDAMPDGGVLSIRTASGEREGRRFARLEVRDTGKGIPAEVLPRIFEPFFTTKEVGKGTGLGLASVFGVVQEHRGTIEVSSEVGRGTTFLVWFPLIDQVPAPANGLAANAAAAGHETVLLVEDETAVRALLGNVLRDLGYRVLEAANGVEALVTVRARGAEIDAVVTDLVMPGGVSGLDLGRALRDEAPRARIIYISGFSAETNRAQAELVEGVNFLPKPFSPRALADLIRERLDLGS